MRCFDDPTEKLSGSVQSPRYVPWPSRAVEGGKRCLTLASLRYLDTVVKIEGVWLFAERLLYVAWLEERALVKWQSAV